MKKFNFSVLFLAGMLMLFSFSNIKAQEDLPDDVPTRQNLNQINRPSLLTELNLSPDQIRQIRLINRQNQPLLRDAQQRLREARNNLDQAIYADNSDEMEVQSRLKILHTTQAEVVRLRSTNEFAVRKILTPEQLTRFREVRQKFSERMEGNANPRNNRRLNAPVQKLINRQRRQRKNN